MRQGNILTGSGCNTEHKARVPKLLTYDEQIFGLEFIYVQPFRIPNTELCGSKHSTMSINNKGDEERGRETAKGEQKGRDRNIKD
jgi:hypothetical protein